MVCPTSVACITLEPACVGTGSLLPYFSSARNWRLVRGQLHWAVWYTLDFWRAHAMSCPPPPSLRLHAAPAFTAAAVVDGDIKTVSLSDYKGK